MGGGGGNQKKYMGLGVGHLEKYGHPLPDKKMNGP